MTQDELNGWKEIASYVGRTVRTAQRWEADLGLPVRRIQGSGGEVIYALPAEIEEWKIRASETKAGQKALQAPDDSDAGNGTDTRSSATREPPCGTPREGDARHIPARAPRRTHRTLTAIGVASLVLAAVTVAAVGWPGVATRMAPALRTVRPGWQNGGLHNGGWPTFAHDMQRSNRRDLAGPVNPQTPRLIVNSPQGFDYSGGTGETDPSRIVATPSGTLVYGECGSIRAITLGGHPLWDAVLAEKPFREGVAGVSIDADGMYLVGTHECPPFVSFGVNVYRFDPAGTLLGKWPIGEMAFAPGIAPSRDWYAISDANLVRGRSGTIDRQGWATDLPGYAHGAVALDSLGNLYVGTIGGSYNQSSLWSLEPEKGRIRWSRRQEQFSTPVVTDDDRVCVAGDTHLFCFDRDGNELWSHEVGSVASLVAPLAVGHSGNIYVRSRDGLIALNRNGKELWRRPPGDGVRSANGPILDKDENVYAAFANEVRSYTPGGTLRWNQPLSDPGLMIIAADGVLCVTSERKNLYAIESPSALSRRISPDQR